MSVSAQDVRHIARLARLGLDDDRVAPLVGELNRILEHMDVLQSVDVRGAVDDALPAGMPLRDDAPATAVPLERDLADIAPAFRDGFFLVPRLATHGEAGSVEESDG